MHEQPPPYQPAPPYGAPQQIELRPNPARYRSQLAKSKLLLVPLLLVILALVAISALAVGSLVGIIVMLVGLAAATAVGIGGTVRYFKVARVEMAPGWIRYTRWSGKPLVIEIARSRGLLARQWLAGEMLLTVVGADGRRAFRLSAGMWTEQDLQTIAHLAGYPTDPTVQRVRDWEARLPGSTTWLDRHPLLFSFMFAFTLVAVFLVIAVVLVVAYVA